MFYEDLKYFDIKKLIDNYMKNSLSEKINEINYVFDTRYLEQENEDINVIKDYYKTNKITYRLFHNWSGFLHMGISKNNTYDESDLLEQVKEVENYVKSINAKNILELGAGRGANSFYLSKNNPSVNCYAIDISTSPIKQYNSKNLVFNIADYHNLSIFDDNYFDIIFAIETICHSDKKEIVLQEVYKKLKKGGVFIIYDGYLSKDKNLLSDEQKIASKLIEKGMAVNQFDTLQSFNVKIKNIGFAVLEEKNLSQNILPTLFKFERLASKFFKYKFLQKLLKAILPEKVIRNAFSGYLMPNLIEDEIALYIKHILKK